MKRLLALLLIVSTLSACRTQCDLCTIDFWMAMDIERVIPDPMWDQVETEFYKRVEALGLIDERCDSLLGIVALMAFVEEQGYPEEFYLNFEDSSILKLVEDMKWYGLDTEKGLHRFLYDQADYARHRCRNYYEFDTVPRDLVVTYGVLDPDSERVSFDLALADGLWRFYGISSLQREGLRKIIILNFFVKMMDRREWEAIRGYKFLDSLEDNPWDPVD